MSIKCFIWRPCQTVLPGKPRAPELFRWIHGCQPVACRVEQCKAMGFIMATTALSTGALWMLLAFVRGHAWDQAFGRHGVHKQSRKPNCK